MSVHTLWLRVGSVLSQLRKIPFVKTVSVKLPHTQYDILIGHNITRKTGEIVQNLCPHQQCALFSDDMVFPHYGQDILTNLQNNGYNVLTQTFPHGEPNKSIHTVNTLYTLCIENALERKSPIIALGGGITGDLIGFVAASYLRGVPFVQIPTTLLAKVDSSVGGKVGYNHPLGKNLIGAFHQPAIVIIDPAFLSSLPKDEFQNGLAECVKHGILGDADLFAWMESKIDDIMRLDPGTLETLIEKNVSLKARIVTQDEREGGIRALLNLGHTFGHAIEVETGYNTYKHGQAVAMGCVAAAHLSVHTGLCHPSVLERTERILQQIGLPIRANLPSVERLMDAMTRDKKVQNGKIRLILPSDIGKTSIITDTPSEMIEKSWRYIRMPQDAGQDAGQDTCQNT